MKGKLSVFFPAHNEEANIRNTVLSALGVLKAMGLDFELIVVDDGSDDGTVKAIEDLISDRLRIVSHPVNMGYGAALRTGINASSGDFILFTDSDGQFNFIDAVDFIAIADTYDCVAGYRVKRADPLRRVINAAAWRMLMRIMFGIRQRDIDCAFKLFRASAVKNLELKSNGAFISAELLYRLNEEGAEIAEIPVGHCQRKSGIQTGAKLNVILRAIKEAVYFKLMSREG